MAGYDNIRDENNNRTPDERRELAIKAGKASGAARRRKAALRDTMNRLLTMQVEVEGLSDILRADGGQSTYEEIITMAMIQKAMQGNVNAFNAIKATVGQTDKSDMDIEEQRARTRQMEAQTVKLSQEPQGEGEDGVEIVNDAPKETDSDFRDCDSEVSADI